MQTEIEVTLTGPAKISGAIRKPGETVRVTKTELAHLQEAGAASHVIVAHEQNTPQSSPEDSLEPVPGEDQAEEQPVGEYPEAAKTTPKAGRDKAKG